MNDDHNRNSGRDRGLQGPPGPEGQQPSTGRIVLFHMRAEDTSRPEEHPPEAPAVVTRAWWDMRAGAWLVNLHIWRDLEAPMAIAEVPFGRTPGCWSWPRRSSLVAAEQMPATTAAVN